MALFDNLPLSGLWRSLLGRVTSPAGKHDTETSAIWTTPWEWRDSEGLYVGHSGEAWLYRKVPINPLSWEDPLKRLDVGGPLEAILQEIGALSTDPTMGMTMTADEREVHILSVTWEEPGEPPAGTPAALAEFEQACLDFLLPKKALVVGVRLKSKNPLLAGGAKSIVAAMKGAGEKVLGESVPNREQWDEDFERIDRIMKRYGAQNPTRSELAQVESWFNLGRGPDVLLQVTKDSIYVDDFDRIEMAVVRSFTDQWRNAPNFQWALDATTHPNGPSVVSVRAQLQTPNAARARARTNLRRRRSQMEEEMLTGDIERIEDTTAFQQSQQVENWIALNREPILTQCSIVMARRVRDADETYIDELRNVHGIEVAPLVMRQLDALDETLPCSVKRVNPFLQDVSISQLAYCGLQGWSNLGDEKGVFLGLADPDYTPVYLDLLGAPAANKAPAMAIFGEPGSGKAQPLDAPILTPSGWVTMGDLRVGDEVVAVDGTATRVAAVYPQGDRPIYRLTFHDGSSVEADGEHLWAVASSTQISRERGYRTMSTTELIASGVQRHAGKRHWRIPTVTAVERPEADLPIDPYLLGLLLGDGSMSTNTLFSTRDQQLEDEMRELLPAGVSMVPMDGRVGDFRLVRPNGRKQPNPLRDALRDLELFSKTSLGKFIPRVYLEASISQRLALLQGLMDTDGEPKSYGAARFYSSSCDLVRDVTELVESLGGTALLTSKWPKYTHKGEERLGAQAFSLAIRLPEGIEPFRLERKRTIWHSVPRPEPVRILDSIEYVGTKPAQCILVEHPSHLYVTARHIVTHNTYICQLIATQAVLEGRQVIFINPKGFDSLSPFAELVGGSVVKMSQLEGQSGYFDPFYYAEPSMAAEIATTFILGVLGNVGVAGMGFTADQELRLAAGLKRGATAGARCVMDALAYVDDPEVKRMVNEQLIASSTFALGIGTVPKDKYQSNRGLTLIEFDRKLDFPEKGKSAMTYSRSERISLAAVRLVTRAAMEILVNSGGGVLVVDEAWTFLSHDEGLAALQQLGREGRSLNLLPIFATQRIADLLREGVDMESYISRVMVMKLTDEREAVAAFKICGLEPTPGRIAFLRTANAQPATETTPMRPAMGIHRDLRDRHAAIYVGPIPASAHEAFTTNPEERRKRDERRSPEGGAQ